MEVVEVIGINKEVIVKALKSGMKDFEDAVQVAAAELNKIECIITRNEKDFSNSNLNIFNPRDFLENQ